MAVTLEIGVCDLLPELLTDALILLSALETAGAVSAGTLQSVLYGLYYFCIFIESDSHGNLSFFLFIIHPVSRAGVSFLFSFWCVNAIINEIRTGG